MGQTAGIDRLLALAGLLALAMAAGTGAASGQETRRIALSPPLGYSALPDSTAARTRVAAVVEGLLVRAGFETVQPFEAAAIRARLLDSVGGYYSRLTGEIVEEKYRAVEAGTLAALRERFGADAWLRLFLVAIPADFSGGKARWDGASEGVAPVGKGTVMALSLAGVLLRGYGDTLYAGQAGIQVLQKVKNDDIVPVPQTKLLSDEDRLNRAAKALVDSLRARLGRKE